MKKFKIRVELIVLLIVTGFLIYFGLWSFYVHQLLLQPIELEVSTKYLNETTRVGKREVKVIPSTKIDLLCQQGQFKIEKTPIILLNSYLLTLVENLQNLMIDIQNSHAYFEYQGYTFYIAFDSFMMTDEIIEHAVIQTQTNEILDVYQMNLSIEDDLSIVMVVKQTDELSSLNVDEFVNNVFLSIQKIEQEYTIVINHEYYLDGFQLSLLTQDVVVFSSLNGMEVILSVDSHTYHSSYYDQTIKNKDEIEFKTKSKLVLDDYRSYVLPIDTTVLRITTNDEKLLDLIHRVDKN